jgi:hypothetical protein
VPDKGVGVQVPPPTPYLSRGFAPSPPLTSRSARLGCQWVVNGAVHRPVVAVIAEDQTGDRVRRQLVHPGDDVGVDVERDGDRGVAKPLADDLHGHAGLERRGGVAVAQAMKGDPRQASRHHVLLEPLREARRVEPSGWVDRRAR